MSATVEAIIRHACCGSYSAASAADLGICSWGIWPSGEDAAGTATVIASELVNLRNDDPLTFLAAAGVLAVVALLAALIPALRAAGLDPTRAAWLSQVAADLIRPLGNQCLCSFAIFELLPALAHRRTAAPARPRLNRESVAGSGTGVGSDVG